LPSPDIYSIKEERESDEDVKHGADAQGRADVRDEIAIAIAASAPASTTIDQLMIVMPKKKLQKRVHWAL
jgi:hypothetical protein